MTFENETNCIEISDNNEYPRKESEIEQSAKKYLIS